MESSVEICSPGHLIFRGVLGHSRHDLGCVFPCHPCPMAVVLPTDAHTDCTAPAMWLRYTSVRAAIGRARAVLSTCAGMALEEGTEPPVRVCHWVPFPPIHICFVSVFTTLMMSARNYSRFWFLNPESFQDFSFSRTQKALESGRRFQKQETLGLHGTAAAPAGRMSTVLHESHPAWIGL